MSNDVAIVTGASRGIGRAIALALARQGNDVVVNYASSAEAAREVVEAIQQIGRDAVAVQADMSDIDAATVLVETAMEKWGRVNVVVNNAGMVTNDAECCCVQTEPWLDAVAR